MLGGRFYIESFFDKHLYVYQIEEFIYSGKTKFQKVDIVKLSFFGKTVFLDEKIQSAECDEFIYHEALTHPSLFIHENPESVYIAGGGEGATLREVLKHKNVKRVRMCDIDKEFVELCEKFLPEWHQGAFMNNRADIVFEDARRDVENLNDNSIDIYISDLTEPLEGGPSALLFTIEYFDTLFKKLKKDGILVFQAGSSVIYYNDFLFSLYKTLKELFPSTFIYEVFIPSFQMSWGFVISLKNKNWNLKNIMSIFDDIQDISCYDLKFLTRDYLKSIFILPYYLEKELKEKGRILTDEKPFIWEGNV